MNAGYTQVLPVGEYYQMLYEADVPRTVLDCIGSELEFQPLRFVIALHEGIVVSAVHSNLKLRYAPKPTPQQQEIGDNLLLVFAAIALARFEQLVREDFHGVVQYNFHTEVRSFIDALNEEGFSYKSGHVTRPDGTVVKPDLNPIESIVVMAPPPDRPASVAQVEARFPFSVHRAVESVKEVPVTTTTTGSGSAQVTTQTPTPQHEKRWSRSDKLAALGIIAGGVLTVLAILASVYPEDTKQLLHQVGIYLHLSKPPQPEQKKP